MIRILQTRTCGESFVWACDVVAVAVVVAAVVCVAVRGVRRRIV